MKKHTKQKIMDRKWKRMESEGMTRPKTSQDNKNRLKACDDRHTTIEIEDKI